MFVCSGNTCRSPMAEYLFKNLLCKYNCSNICCESAGVYAQNGNGASVNSFVVLKEIGIDLGLHKSKNIFTVNFYKIL